MKSIFMFCALAVVLCTASAQSTLPANDPNLINLQTPMVVKKSEATVQVDARVEGGYAKTLGGDLGIRYGFWKDLELDFASSLAKWNAASFANGEIRFGGTDEELSLRYKFDDLNITVQGGVAYVQTPQQDDRIAGTLGASYGYAPTSKVRLYLNPRAVFLDHNSLVGIGLGGAVDLASGVSLTADWTPLVAGDNTISTTTLGRSRSQLYSAGLSFSNLVKGATFGIGVTNATGITTGSSLTPTLGDSPALFVSVTYHF